MKKKGFTLIEILVVSLVLMIIIELTYNFFISNIKISTDERKKAYIESNVKNLMDYMIQSMQSSFQDTINSASTDELTLKIPKNNNSSDSSNISNCIPIMFKYDNANKSINIIKDSNTTSSLLGYVDNFIVTKDLYNNCINIKILINYNIRDLKRTYEINYNIRKD